MKQEDIAALEKSILASLGTVVNDAVAAALKKEQTPEPAPRLQPPVVEERLAHIGKKRNFDFSKPENIGIPAARFIRALAFGRGNHEAAKWFAAKAWNDDLGDEIQKALMAQDLTAGGALVPSEYAAELIMLLRSKTVVRRAGARTVPMDSGTLNMRRQTAGSAANYVGESENIGITQPETGLMALVAKKLAAIVPISNDLLKYTNGTADDFVRDDLVLEMASREDRAFLRDDGTQHTPRGLRNWALPGNIVGSGGTTPADIETDFRGALNRLEGADVGLTRPAWFMHPSRKNYLAWLREAAGGQFIYPETRQANPTLMNWPIFFTTAIPANLGGGTESEIILADMNDVIIGEAGGLEIVVDASAAYQEGNDIKSAFQRDETLIRAISRHDIGVRYRESITVIKTVAWGV